MTSWASVGGLGPLLGPMLAVFGPMLAVLGRSWGLCWRSWSVLGPKWSVMGRSGRSWKGVRDEMGQAPSAGLDPLDPKDRLDPTALTPRPNLFKRY